MQKTIGIIGSGMIGKQVAKLALNAGYKVAICNSRAPETLAEFITSLKGDIRALNLEGVANFTDMLVVAIPFEAYTKLPVKLLAGKIVINTMN
ncbi:MAG: NAD(P)-binding domain-containing protein, partial [Campylobacter curvus]